MRYSNSSINDRVCDVVASTFELDRSTIGPETGYENPEAWDSLGHIRLLMEIEQEFSVRLPAGRMSQTTTVAQLCSLLDDLVKEK